MNNKGLVVSVGAGFPQTPFIKKLKDEKKIDQFVLEANKLASELGD